MITYAESTGFGDCGSLGGESYAGSKDSVDTGGGDCGSPGTLVSPALNMLPPPIAADYDLERQQRLNTLDPDETDEEELAKIETLRQHVYGALGITSADEVPEDLFPLFGKSSLVRFGRAKRWKYKRATKMFVEMLCWYRSYDLPRQMRQWENVDSESHVGRVFQKYMPIGTFGTDKRGAPVFYSLPDVREIGFEAYERGSLYLIHKTVRSIEDVSLERGRHLLHANVVFDMQDVSWVRLIANLKPFARHVKTQDDNMPERLYTCLVIRAPLVFTAAWKLLKPLLATETVDKVSILGRRAGPTALGGPSPWAPGWS
ncbi:hypothetical protein EMIHUDRAFT_195300 [Emiliania huxleyi CCMP1516]|uniref:CRAL-TRIO domain-containing protein n=2 Tax=Emiliania huxleyi TaxID=2903 RepID=A0A0D3JH97_EMIH1|nr:hypothetical protein EMIHUDRAFT_195300 [Emiliania huxleyi CCMP1516]EOD22882.1 hypothetical protein EMIHUDRAFT_195300 [Emiliania huxleyi CCMP1516]|eukprot:XP_005775311.1 hypothetical protein EMIHUDRAFT_195300 [Emiliania huxleyi CCMP1516]